MPPVSQVVMAVAFAIPCFTMAARLFRVWRDPMGVEDGRWVRIGTGVFVLEFVLLHAGILLGAAGAGADTLAGKVGATLGLTAFYELFAGAVALGFQSRMLFTSFLWMIGGRFVALAVGISERDTELLTAHSVVGMMIYFAMVLVSVVLPIPRLGITPQVAAATRQPNASGTWVDHPHRAIGAAAVYFLLLGVVELSVMTWIDPGTLMPN
jgi:hypothetical protein